MIQGKIIKGIAGFYYVHVVGSGIYECKAKGAFRNQKLKPLVGDDCQLEVIDEDEKKGNIREILPRKNSLIRPAVANVDQALVIFAATSPEPNLNLLDRFLCMMEQQQVKTVIAFNKCDLVDQDYIDGLRAIYSNSGYDLLFFSAKENQGIEAVREVLADKTTTVAGPSGVGKSSLINKLSPDIQMETGDISQKVQRGKHTTRHSELITLDENTYIFDTPGFSSLSTEFFELDELTDLFPEFVEWEPNCKFAGCSHIGEPSCGIKQAMAEGHINDSRYSSYVQMYNEIKGRRKY